MGIVYQAVVGAEYGDRYVGYAADLDTAIETTSLLINSGKNRFFDAVQKHGIENVRWDVLEENIHPRQLRKRASWWIQDLDSVRNGLNEESDIIEEEDDEDEEDVRDDTSNQPTDLLGMIDEEESEEPPKLDRKTMLEKIRSRSNAFNQETKSESLKTEDESPSTSDSIISEPPPPHLLESVFDKIVALEGDETKANQNSLLCGALMDLHIRLEERVNLFENTKTSESSGYFEASLVKMHADLARVFNKEIIEPILRDRFGYEVRPRVYIENAEVSVEWKHPKYGTEVKSPISNED